MLLQKETLDLLYLIANDGKLFRSYDLDDLKQIFSPFVKSEEDFNFLCLEFCKRKKFEELGGGSMCPCSLHSQARLKEALGFKLTESTKHEIIKMLTFNCDADELDVLEISLNKGELIFKTNH